MNSGVVENQEWNYTVKQGQGFEVHQESNVQDVLHFCSYEHVSTLIGGQ